MLLEKEKQKPEVESVKGLVDKFEALDIQKPHLKSFDIMGKVVYFVNELQVPGELFEDVNDKSHPPELHLKRELVL